MLVEAFRRLSDFGELRSYQYIGFGSLFFSDFSLIHRSLGVEQMYSIEDAQDPVIKQRFESNVPFGHIQMLFGHSNNELPSIDWSMRSIVWMDYDGSISKSVLDDVDFLVRTVPPGSVVLFTVNAENIREPDDDSEDAEKMSLIDRLKKSLGDGAVPYHLKSSDLSGWGVAKAYRAIIHGIIERALVRRNAVLRTGARIQYRQLFNFHYSDNAKMLTVGGILYDVGQSAIFAKCAFDSLPFIRSDAEAFSIQVPNLTYREMRELDCRLPKDEINLPVPASDIEKYRQTYRYFPRFVEAELS
jgi:hypothetical protein